MFFVLEYEQLIKSSIYFISACGILLNLWYELKQLLLPTLYLSYTSNYFNSFLIVAVTIAALKTVCMDGELI